MEKYDELKKFSDIQINFYRKLNILLQSQDIRFQTILNKGLLEKNTSSHILEGIIFTLEETLISKIDIISYIINLNKTFGSTDSDINKTIKNDIFFENINTLYKKNIKQLKYYYSNYIYNKKKYD